MNTSPSLLHLPASHQAILAALTCEKMLPSICKFDEQETRPGQPLFEQAIAALFAFGLGTPLSHGDYQQLQAQLEAFWPDLDESANDFASYAFDACGALGEALNFVQHGNSQHVVHCLTAATDTVDMYVQDRYDLNLAPAELNAFIDATPLMQQEVHRQHLLVHELSRRSTLDVEFLAYLRGLNAQYPLVDLTLL